MPMKKTSDVIGKNVAAKKLVTRSPKYPISKSIMKKAGFCRLNYLVI